MIPGVVGQPQAAAAGAMNSAGLTTTIAKIGATLGCHLGLRGVVMATSPAAGTASQAPVTLMVCNIPPASWRSVAV